MLVIAKNLFISIALLAIIGSISYGVVYISGQENKASSSFKKSHKTLEESRKEVSPEVQAIIVSEENRLQSEQIKLDDLRKQFNLDTSVEIAMKNELSKISEKVLNESAELFTGLDISNTSLKAKTPEDVTKDILYNKQKVLELIKKIETVGKEDREDIVIVKKYIEDLKEITENMTTKNSGLSQDEIEKEKSVVVALEKAVQVALENISKIDQVAKQEEIIRDIDDRLNVLRETAKENESPSVTPDDNNQDDRSGTTTEDRGRVELPGYSYETNVFEDDSPSRDIIPVKYFPVKKVINPERPEILQGSDL